MVQKGLSYFLLLVIIVFTSCTANHLVHKAQEAPLVPLNFEIRVDSIHFTDSRKNVAETEIDLPFMSWPNQVIQHYPALTTAHKQVIEQTIKSNTIHSGIPVRVEVEVIDAYKEFSASWSRERERGYAELQLNFYNIETGEQVGGCLSQGGFYVESADATKKRMEKVYQVSLKNVSYNCLKAIYNQNQKNNPQLN